MILPLIAFIGLGIAVDKYAGPPIIQDLPMTDAMTHKEMALMLEEFEKDEQHD